ncbi:MAG: glycosyltransferase family 39 protein, partial [Chloroflexota bacterium]
MHSRYSIIGLAVIVALKLILGALAVVQVPLWTAYHHEIDSYNIARLIAEEGRLPQESDFPPGQFEVRQGSQPPLYGLLTAPVAGVFGEPGRVAPQSNPFPVCVGGAELVTLFESDTSYSFPPSGHARGGYALRSLNVLFGVLAVLFVYGAGSTVAPDKPLIALTAAGLLAFEPYTLLMNSMIINDNLLLMVAAANLFFAVRVLQRPRPLDVVLLWVTALLGTLTKLNGWVLPGLAALVMLVLAWRAVRPLRITRRGLLIGMGAVLSLLVVFGGVLAFNQMQYGTIYGRYNAVPQGIERVLSRGTDLLGVLPAMFGFTLTDYAAAVRDVPLPGRVVSAYEWTAALLVVFTAVGAVVSTVRRDWPAVRTFGIAAAVFGATVLMVFARNAQSQLVID